MSVLFSPSADAPLSEWQHYLETLHVSAIDLELERVSQVALNAKVTKPAPKVITVSGTNGKGSTCAIIEAILQAAGYKTGVYSSPHLIRYNERVRINGKELEDQEHTLAFSEIERHRKGTSLSFFEFGTLAALWLFIENKVDIAILEVGLGGRLDATNLVDPDVSVITSIAIDHVDWLGDDIEKIGHEKAGIFRHDKPAVCGQVKPPASLSAFADEIGARFHQVGYQFDYQRDGDVWHWNCGAFDLKDLPIPALPLPNAATAIMAIGLSNLNVSDKNIVSALKTVTLPGRLERISHCPYVLLDVAHNPQSSAYLAEQITQIKRKGLNVHAVVGMLKDKDISETLLQMKDVVDHWYPASIQAQRGAHWSLLTAFLPQGTQGYDSPISAYKAAEKRAFDPSKDMIIVFGSFLTVGEMTAYFSKVI